MINTPLRAELLALQRADLELREQLAVSNRWQKGRTNCALARPPKPNTRLPTIGNIGEQNANGRD